MGKIVERNKPCLNPECGSHDARQVYDNGTSFCFSCSKWFSKSAEKKAAKEETVATAPEDDKEVQDKIKQQIEEIEGYESRGFKDRGITKEVAKFFNVKVSYNSAGEIDTHYYPYLKDGVVGYKVRRLPKSFTIVGHASGLFGKNLFSGAGKRLVITEGEIDALSVAQAYMDKYKKIYPVVSLTSASDKNALLENRDWVRSFQEVVLCLDSDKPGEEATSRSLKQIGIDKVKICKLPQHHKDANDILTKLGGERLLQIIWDAEPWKPAGLIQKDKLWEELTAYNEVHSVPYPDCLKGVTTKTKGMRPGEISLFVSGTGSGKSTLFREIGLHVLETTNDKIGIISLEEGPAETARKMSGMAIGKNPAKEEIPIEELKIGFEKVFGSDRVVILDHQGSISDSSIVDQLEYMALIGCKYLFIDHITILVSEGADDLKGNEAIDKIMNDLLRLVKRHPIWVGLISHLRKTSQGGRSFEEGKLPSIDDIKGSGSIKQISFDIIAFARNMIAKDERERNSIKMSVLKCRYTGLTGPVPGAYYNYDTGRLAGLESTDDNENFDVL